MQNRSLVPPTQEQLMQLRLEKIQQKMLNRPLVRPTQQQLMQSLLRKQQKMQMREQQLQKLKDLLERTIVDSGYAHTVDFGDTIHITHSPEETQLAVDAHVVSIKGTEHTIRLEQPYTFDFRAHGPRPHKGVLRTSSISKEFTLDRDDAESSFKHFVKKLILSDDLPFPIHLTHPRPVGNAPFDPYGEREDEYEQRIMMWTSTNSRPW